MNYNRPSMTEGKWHEIATPDEYRNILRYGKKNPDEDDMSWGCVRVCEGKWQGPGKYLELNYQQRCPRNCCWDDVRELVPADEVADSVREEMRELAQTLKEARS